MSFKVVNPENAEAVRHALASAPPVSIGALSLFGVGMSDWLLIVSILWVLMQMTWFIMSKFKQQWRKTTITVEAPVVPKDE